MNSLKKDIWDSKLDADMNVRYWSSLARRYNKREKAYKIFLGIMASGTVASWNIWSEIQIVWKLLSGISALMAIALPILNWSKMIQNTTNVAQKWHQIKIDYEIIWFSLNHGKSEDLIIEEFINTKKKEVLASKEEADLPVKTKLLEKCYNEVLKSTGL